MIPSPSFSGFNTPSTKSTSALTPAGLWVGLPPVLTGNGLRPTNGPALLQWAWCLPSTPWTFSYHMKLIKPTHYSHRRLLIFITINILRLWVHPEIGALYYAGWTFDFNKFHKKELVRRIKPLLTFLRKKALKSL